MNARPLRRRVALWSAASTGLVLVAFCGATIVTLYVEQVRAADADLVRAGRLIREQAGDPGGVPAAALRVAAAFRPGVQIAVVGADGAVVARSGKASPFLAEGKLGATRQFRWRDWTLWRLRREAAGPYTLFLARDLDADPDVVDELLVAYLISLPVALALVAAAAGWLGRRALRPVGELADAAAAVTADHLSARLPVPPAQDELGRLAQVLNGMLGRLERSFHQTRRFAADASHELRTPLTIMRGEVEAALGAGGFSPEQERRLVSLLEETARLSRITEDLLLLARLDAGAPSDLGSEVDLTALLRDALEDGDLLAGSRRIRFEASLAKRVRVHGDAGQLRRVLLNLVDNAVKFNQEGGRVECVLSVETPEAVLRIGNTGKGIPPDAAPRLFERFSRGLEAPDGRRGTGLGLSLCREILSAHGGRIALASGSRADWTEFEVRLPLGGW